MVKVISLQTIPWKVSMTLDTIRACGSLWAFIGVHHPFFSLGLAEMNNTFLWFRHYSSNHLKNSFAISKCLGLQALFFLVRTDLGKDVPNSTKFHFLRWAPEQLCYASSYPICIWMSSGYNWNSCFGFDICRLLWYLESDETFPSKAAG